MSPSFSLYTIPLHAPQMIPAADQISGDRPALEAENGERCKRIKSAATTGSNPTPRDLLSAMDDKILLRILSLLPSTKDAVKTRILSKRFLNLSNSLPILNFQCPDEPVNDNFLDFVDQTLVLHMSPGLEKLGLSFAYDDQLCSRVNLWVRFASEKGAEELELNFVNVGVAKNGANRLHPYTLPFHLCQNSTLRSLKLRFCRFSSRVGSIGWGNLRVLWIEYMILDDGSIQKILSGCSTLKELKLVECGGFDKLDIVCANLKTLEFRGNGEFLHSEPELAIRAPFVEHLGFYGSFRRKFRLEDINPQSEVSLDFELLEIAGFGENNCTEYRNYVLNLCKGLIHAQKLVLGAWIVWVAAFRETTGMSSPLLKCQMLACQAEIEILDFSALLHLVHSLPDLKKLTLIFDCSTSDDLSCDQRLIREWNESGRGGGSHLDSSNSNSNKIKPFGSLKTVTMLGCSGSQAETSFLKSVLENAFELEQMTIRLNNVGRSRDVACELFAVSRASAKAAVKLY